MSEEQANEAPEVTATQAADEEVIDQVGDAVRVQTAAIGELTPTDAAGEPIGIDHLMDVPVRVTVEVGRTSMPLGELVKLVPGSLVTLDRESHEPADILVNGKVVASGDVVTIGGHYGIRITRVVD